MRFKPRNCKRLQGAAGARRRARRRPFVLQVPDNKADAVPCGCFHFFSEQASHDRASICFRYPFTKSIGFKIKILTRPEGGECIVTPTTDNTVQNFNRKAYSFRN